MMLYNYSGLWYTTSFTFIIGIIWSIYKEKIDKIIKKNKKRYSVFLVVFILFSIFTIFSKFTELIIIDIFSMIFFVIAAILFMYKIPVNFFITRFLGRISFGIYVMQGLFLGLFRRNTTNQLLYCFEVVMATFIAAILFHIVQKNIYKRK